MEVFYGVADVPDDIGPTAVTLGNFDGVHLGHQAVLGQLAARARSSELRSVALTFDPHPRRVHRPHEALPLITGLSHKLERMGFTGIDAVVVAPYDLDFARATPEEFVREVFVEALHAKLVMVGGDVRFGRDNSGTIDTLRELGRRFDFEVVTIDEVGEGARVSSTRIRELVAAGCVDEAAAHLGHFHAMVGEVVHGDARGRELGFPTANFSRDAEGLVPADGVYAGWASFDPRPDVRSDTSRFMAAVSVGTNPTFDGQERRVEAYVMDPEFAGQDVYGARMTVEFVKRIRGQVNFDGLDELVARMHLDVEAATAVLRS